MKLTIPQRAAIELYAGFTDADVIYAARCCGRISLARTPQTRCSSCPTVPEVTAIRSTDELVQWAGRIPEQAHNPAPIAGG